MTVPRSRPHPAAAGFRAFFQPGYQTLLFVSSVYITTTVSAPGTPYYSEALDTAVKVLWLPVAAYAAFTAATHHRTLFRLLPLFLLAALHAWFFSSVAGVIPTAFLIPVATFVAYSECTEEEIEKYLRWLIYIVIVDGLIGVVTLAAGIYVPDTIGGATGTGDPWLSFGGPRLTGIRTEGSAFPLSVASAIVAVCLLPSGRRRTAMMVFLLPMVVLAKGKAAMVAAAIFLIGWYLVRWRAKLPLYVFCAAVVAVTVLSVSYLSSEHFRAWAGTDAIRLLGGRDEWFDQGMAFLADNLMFGNLGAEFFVRDEFLVRTGRAGLASDTHVHNLFLYWMTRFGLVYSGLMLLQLFALVRISPTMILYLTFMFVVGFFQISLLRGWSTLDATNALLLLYLTKKYAATRRPARGFRRVPARAVQLAVQRRPYAPSPVTNRQCAE